MGWECGRGFEAVPDKRGDKSRIVMKSGDSDFGFVILNFTP